MYGKVKVYNEISGYGFIECEDGHDVFVNYTEILGMKFRVLKRGDMVEFEIVNGVNGSEAANVTIIQEP